MVYSFLQQMAGKLAAQSRGVVVCMLILCFCSIRTADGGSIAGSTACSTGAGGPSQCNSVGHYCSNGVCTQCDPSSVGCGWRYDSMPSAITILNARHPSNANIVPTSSVGIPDLSGASGMTWKLPGGTISYETVDGIPCWNMNGGILETTTRTTLGDSYTIFYYWKPRFSDTGYRTLHRGTEVRFMHV